MQRRVNKGNRLSAKDFNDLVNEATRVGELTAAPPLEIVSTGDSNLLRWVDTSIRAVIVANSSSSSVAVAEPSSSSSSSSSGCRGVAYSWQEVQPDGEGEWLALDGLRSGEQNAYEANGRCCDEGAIVYLQPRDGEDYVFWLCCSVEEEPEDEGGGDGGGGSSQSSGDCCSAGEVASTLTVTMSSFEGCCFCIPPTTELTKSGDTWSATTTYCSNDVTMTLTCDGINWTFQIIFESDTFTFTTPTPVNCSPFSLSWNSTYYTHGCEACEAYSPLGISITVTE
jgi:hypothetical protein